MAKSKNKSVSFSNVESVENHSIPEVASNPNRTSYFHKLTEEERKDVREKVGRGELAIMGPDSIIVIP